MPAFRKASTATLVVMAGMLAPLPASAEAATSLMDRCLLNKLSYVSDKTTIGELRSACLIEIESSSQSKKAAALPPPAPDEEAEEPTAVERRLAFEAETEGRPFVITPHRPNYILPLTYNSKVNEEPFAFSGASDDLRHTEIKFQLSFKLPLAYNLFNETTDLYFAYTNQSWWQAYSGDISSPFRETNHEPEIFFSYHNDWEVLGFRNRLINIGLNHQSNGRAEPLSRSWNRIVGSAVFDRGDLGVLVRAWYRIPEDDEDDDNPKITKYMGHGDVRAAYVWRENTFQGMLRNNLSTSDNKGAIELTWSRQLFGPLRLYTQYFNGYGESLIDHDHRVNRLGIGFAINDYLQ